MSGSRATAPATSRTYWLLAALGGVLVGGAAATSPTLAPALVLLLLTGVLLAATPRAITYVLVATFPFSAALPRGLLPVFKLDELLIAAGLVLVMLKPGRKRWRWTLIDALFLVLVLVGTILPAFGSLLRSEMPEPLEAVALLKPYLIYRLVVMSIDSSAQLRLVVRLLLLTSIAVAVIALLQVANVPGVRLGLGFVYQGSAAAMGLSLTTLRATSTLGNWNALGAYAAFGVVLSLVAIRHGAALVGRSRLLPSVAFLANLTSLLLSGSSSSFIGALVAVGVWAAHGRQGRLRARHVAGAMLIVMAGAALALTVGREVIGRQLARQSQDSFKDRVTGQVVETHGLPQSVVGRYVLAEYLLDMMARDGLALVTGFGPGEATRDRLPWGTAESGYVSMLFYYGPLYLLIYLLLLVAVMGRAARAGLVKTRGPPASGMATAALALTAAMAVINIISSYYSAAGVTHYYWIVVAGMVLLTEHEVDA